MSSLYLVSIVKIIVLPLYRYLKKETFFVVLEEGHRAYTLEFACPGCRMVLFSEYDIRNLPSHEK